MFRGGKPIILINCMTQFLTQLMNTHLSPTLDILLTTTNKMLSPQCGLPTHDIKAVPVLQKMPVAKHKYYLLLYECHLAIQSMVLTIRRTIM